MHILAINTQMAMEILNMHKLMQLELEAETKAKYGVMSKIK